MKRKLILYFALLFSVCSASCTDTTAETSSETSNETSAVYELQKEILAAEGLPENYDELTPSQQHTTDRICKMLLYLNEKYNQPFSYADYTSQPETLTAYSKSIGEENEKFYVTVTAENDSFTDNYCDFNVSDLAKELTNEFLTDCFGDSYKYFMFPLASEITMAEMQNSKFQWKYGASNCIFLLESDCSIDDAEEFAVAYAKFLYEHEILGTHRIQILDEFPEELAANTIGDVYANYDRLCTGFYYFHTKPSKASPEKYYTIYTKYDPNSAGNLGEIFHIAKEYPIEEYFSKE